MKKLAISAAVLAASAAVLAVPATANARTGSTLCTVVHDHITKTDSGHGTPAEWADLSLARLTSVCPNPAGGYTVHLVDIGALWTRTGAGTPNGTGGQITRRVRGLVHGVYDLTATGALKSASPHGDVTASSTDYVKSLFTPESVVTGGAYNWTYVRPCEQWVDSSANSDGQGAAAGNITGKVCPGKPTQPPTSTPTPAPSTTTGSPAPSPSGSTPPGVAPAPTPVTGDLPVTG
ncbi:MAG: hypothetical protein JWR24_5126 [Actinoallomurus sp.]|nr:hypothetical protein [Actinoallomurus sp.]